MKKHIITIALGLLLAAPATVAQQALNVIQNATTYNFSATDDIITLESGTTLTIQGTTFNLADINRMAVVEDIVADNNVLVQYTASGATVSVAGNIAPYIKATVKGAHVVIDQDDKVSDKTCGEIIYVLQGESADGSFKLNGSFKATIELQGLNLTNPSGAAIDIQNGKRIELSAKKDTENNISDGKGDQKGAIYCKGHLELKGKGTLNVTGKQAHAISSKEYVSMQNCTVNIKSSVKDAINCAQYFLLKSGTLNITNPGDDGIQVSYKDTDNREEEDTGSITISDGTLTIDKITATAATALKAEGNFSMTGGQLIAATAATGEWDSAKAKIKASSCISIDGNIDITGGTVTLTASGPGSKGITCNGNLNFNKATLSIATSGGVLAYHLGSLDENYTGDVEDLTPDQKSSPKGIKCDGPIVIDGGNINIVTSGNGGEGIESKSTLTVNNGNIKIRAKEDAINSEGTLTINGGTVDVISIGNDGLDSNADIYIKGGLVLAFGSILPEYGIDVPAKGGYSVYFTGGCILAAGGSNSLPTNTGSTQPYVTLSSILSADTAVTIGTDTQTLYTFTTPADLTSVDLGGSTGNRPGGPNGMGTVNSSIVISVPGLVAGTTYNIQNGSSTVTATAQNTAN